MRHFAGNSLAWWVRKPVPMLVVKMAARLTQWQVTTVLSR